MVIITKVKNRKFRIRNKCVYNNIIIIIIIIITATVALFKMFDDFIGGSFTY